MTQVAAGQGEGLRFDPYMAGMDVMMWAVEQDPRLKLGIVSVLLLDRPVDPERFRAAVARTAAAGPRMRQVIVRSGLSTAPPRFVEDPDFDLDFHTPVIAVPGEGTLDDVLRLAEHVGSAGFDYRRPLWEFCLVTGVQGGGCAILQKVHHVLTDGVGGLQFIVGPLLSVTRRESPADAGSRGDRDGRDGRGHGRRRPAIAGGPAARRTARRGAQRARRRRGARPRGRQHAVRSRRVHPLGHDRGHIARALPDASGRPAEPGHDRPVASGALRYPHRSAE